jgi:hypothetical protein
MPSPDLTASQSTLLQAMRQVIAAGDYQNSFQAIFPHDTPPSIVFFHCHRAEDVMTVRGAKIDFLALIQHEDIVIIHQGGTAYWGYLHIPTVSLT